MTESIFDLVFALLLVLGVLVCIRHRDSIIYWTLNTGSGKPEYRDRQLRQLERRKEDIEADIKKAKKDIAEADSIKNPRTFD